MRFLFIALLCTIAVLILAGTAHAQEPTPTPGSVGTEGIDPNGDYTLDIRPAAPCGNLPCSALRCEEWLNPKLLDNYLPLLPLLGLLGLRFRSRSARRLLGRRGDHRVWGGEESARQGREALARMPESMKRRRP